jgi:hypothetical protein
VGVIAYRGLTGEVPFKSLQLDELVYKVALGRFVPPSERVTGLDPELNAIVCQAMARLPEQRFQDADQFIAALDRWLERTGEFPLSATPGPRSPARSTPRSLTRRSASPSEPHLSPVPTPPIPLGAVGVATSGPTAAGPGPSALGPTTHLTTELVSERSRRQTLRRRTWGAATLTVALGAAAGLMLWRAQTSSESELVQQEFAVQPAPAAEPPAAEPPPQPLPAAAPPAANVAANLPGTRLVDPPAAAGRASASSNEKRSDSAKPDSRALAKAGRTAKREHRVAAGTRPAPTPAAPAGAAPPSAATPAGTARDPAKTRPDWGY